MGNQPVQRSGMATSGRQPWVSHEFRVVRGYVLIGRACAIRLFSLGSLYWVTDGL